MKTKITIEQLVLKYAIRYYSHKIHEVLHTWEKDHPETNADVEDGWLTADELIDIESKYHTEEGRKASWYFEELREILDDDDKTLLRICDTIDTAIHYILKSRREKDHDRNHWAPLVTVWDGDECIDAGLREDLTEAARAAGYDIRTIC